MGNRSSVDAVYKGIAIASNGGDNFLYLTNFKNNSVDMFDGDFAFVKSFTDPTVPAGYAPFGIANIGGQLFVTFAKQLGPDNEDSRRRHRLQRNRELQLKNYRQAEERTAT